MQIVIEISDTLKNIADNEDAKTFSHIIWQALLMDAIKNGKPLPEGHGRLIDTDVLEDKIVENNCTTVHCDDIDEWYQEVLRCTSCDRLFMLDEFKEGIIGCHCPYCGKKIISYKED